MLKMSPLLRQAIPTVRKKVTTIADGLVHRAEADIVKTQQGFNRGQQLVRQHWEQDPKILTNALTSPELRNRVKQTTAATAAALVIAGVQQPAAKASPLWVKMLNPLAPAAEQVIHKGDVNLQAQSQKVLPDFSTNLDGTLKTSPENLMLELLKQNKGVSIGEQHTSVTDKTFLIQNMANLKKAGVKTLFAEMLDYNLNLALNNFCNTGLGLPEITTTLRDVAVKSLPLWGVKPEKQAKVVQGFVDSWTSLIKTAKNNDMCTVGINSNSVQIGTLIQTAQQNMASKAKNNSFFGLGGTNYLNNANAHWAGNIKDYYQFYPEHKNSRFIVINGAAHNANNGLDNQLNIPSVYFNPSSDTTKNKIKYFPNQKKDIDVEKITNLNQPFGNDYMFEFSEKP